MQGKDTTNSTFFQLFEPFNNENFQKTLKQLEVDKYFKKLNTVQMIELISYAQLNQLKSLRDISSSFNNKDFQEAIGQESFSASQISRRLMDLPTELLENLFKELVKELGNDLGFHKINQPMNKLYLIDSSTISLCLSQYPWADFRKTKAGIKLHLRLVFHDHVLLPDDVIITPAKPSDKTQMDALVVEDKEALHVFDRAYVDYDKFDHYCEEGINFVTRLKKNAVIDVVETLPVIGSIQNHQIVYLGTPMKKMKHPLRLIEVSDTEGNPVIIITNNFTLDMEEISDIYRNRWQIELFFKWLKQNMYVKHFYGLSQQAVMNQLLIALITYCLLLSLQLKTGFTGPLLGLKRILKTCLYEPFTYFVRTLHRKPSRSSKGRRAIDYDLIFAETERQVIAGEVEHLYDVTYDPLYL